MKITKKQREWLWFIGLWCAGLLSVSIAGYLIKFLMFAFIE